MGKYHPGTLDDELVIARRNRAETRILHTVSGPSGSQMRATSARVGELEADIGEALESIRQSIFSPGTVMCLSEDVSPTTKGYSGQWQRLGSLPTDDDSKPVYFFERMTDV